MEEIDSIIIDSLKNLNCDIEDNVKTLKQLDADMVTAAISSCLQAITGNVFSKKLPPQMSLRLKAASNLAEQVKEVGFRGDLGYQTILYSNEVEMRRVLMFLIERLPQDVHKTVEIEETSYVHKLLKQIEEKVKQSLDQVWLPSNVLNHGTRPVGDDYIVNSLGDSIPVQTRRLKVINSSGNESLNEAAKHYSIHVLPEVTRQVTPNQLLPSLLFGEKQFSCEYFKNTLKGPRKRDSVTNISHAIEELHISSEENVAEKNVQESPTKVKIQELLHEIEEEKDKFKEIQEALRKSELQLWQIKSMKEEEEAVLKDTLSKVKVKVKALKIASKDENKLKLKTVIENGTDYLVELANQWNQVQTPLIEEFRSLQNSLSSEELKQQQELSKLQNLRQVHDNLLADLKEKELVEEGLAKKIQQINKTNSRSAYTMRIMEIIGNIKKQHLEILKVLADTKEVQKEINNLTGQVDRSFTLCDELIFRDAKYDEVARKAYKLLATLRDECSIIIKAVTEIGVVEREVRNTQDQIDIESAKQIPEKLERVLLDLDEIRKEAKNLASQNK